jgi:short-subunit dehydrogenase
MNIVITGASSGIGFQTAKQLSKDSNNTIFAVARRIDFLNNLASQAHYKNIIPFKFDLQKDDFLLLAKEIQEEFGLVDLLINNAGALLHKPFLDTQGDEMVDLFHSNFFSIAKTIQSLAPIITNNGHILNIGSMGGFQGSLKFPGLSFYSASKAALASLTESLAEELKPFNIKVNCLALGAVQTEMLSKAFPDYTAPISAEQMGAFIADFAIKGHFFYNGKILPVSVSTP